MDALNASPGSRAVTRRSAADHGLGLPAFWPLTEVSGRYGI
jgi:hypothetical protein